MCTLILGNDVLGPGTILLAANRDERQARPTDPPGVLMERPRVVGGRDRMAGGTWLAIHERQAAVAILNRREVPSFAGPDPPKRRSRGLLAIDVAAVDRSPLAEAALERARAALSASAYAPFTLVFAAPGACWALAHDGHTARHQEIAPGWHVITHQDLDDPAEPRTAFLLDQLRDWQPHSAEEAERRLINLLQRHQDPRVCLHDGVMVTVSSSLVRFDAGGARYLHAEGRPCETIYQNLSRLLAAPETV